MAFGWPASDAVAALTGGLAGSIRAVASLGKPPPLDAVAALTGGLAGSVRAAAGLGPTPAARLQRARRATAPVDILVNALELTHATANPVRLVDATENRTVAGDTYHAERFDVVWADHRAGQAPRARVVVDNVGRTLSTWIRRTNGGLKGQARLIQLIDGVEDRVAWEVTMEIDGLAEAGDSVSMTLGFDALLSRPAVRLRYDPETAPGLF